MEMAASQRMYTFQSEELNARRGMLNGLISHMDPLRYCESENAEHLARETRHRQIVQGRLHHGNLQVSTLRS
eukprot:12902209-Prorocentrum_lima.AAC.1